MHCCSCSTWRRVFLPHRHSKGVAPCKCAVYWTALHPLPWSERHSVRMQALHHIIPHPGNNVRSLDCDRKNGRLATCSFDKTVKIFRPEVANSQ